MGDEGSRFDLPKAARVPLGGEGQGGSEEREFLRRLGGFDLPPPTRKPQVRSRPLDFKYWLLAGPAILAIVVSIGIYTLVPGLRDGKFTLVAVHPEPSSASPPPTATGDDKIQPSPAKWSDHAAQLQLAPRGAASPEASVLATTGSSVGRSTSPDPHDVASATSVAAVSADAQSPAQTPAPEAAVHGVSDKEILFGMAAPFSGASRELGREMKIGVETAFNQINDAGGENGRLLRTHDGGRRLRADADSRCHEVALR